MEIRLPWMRTDRVPEAQPLDAAAPGLCAQGFLTFFDLLQTAPLLPPETEATVTTTMTIPKRCYFKALEYLLILERETCHLVVRLLVFFKSFGENRKTEI